MRKYKNGGPNYNLFQSFRFALKGIGYAIKHERNLRIHFSAMTFVLYFSVRFYHFSEIEYAILLLVIGLVIICEMINTAVEKAVDVFAPTYSGLAKISKDVAAGAVLVAAVTALLVSGFLFWDITILKTIIDDILRHIPIWIFVIAIQVLWVVWPRRNAIIRRSKIKKR